MDVDDLLAELDQPLVERRALDGFDPWGRPKVATWYEKAILGNRVELTCEVCQKKFLTVPSAQRTARACGSICRDRARKARARGLMPQREMLDLPHKPWEHRKIAKKNAAD